MSPEKIPTRTRLALAQKMRFLRFTRGWSQEVLAELAGLHRTYISQIERGQVSAAPVLPAPAALVLPWTSRQRGQFRETRRRLRAPRPRAPHPTQPGGPRRALQRSRHRRATGVLWPGFGRDDALTHRRPRTGRVPAGPRSAYVTKSVY